MVVVVVVVVRERDNEEELAWQPLLLHLLSGDLRERGYFSLSIDCPYLFFYLFDLPRVTEVCFKQEKMKKQGSKQPVRLYVRGIVLGYKRSKVNQYPSCSLIQLEGVHERKDTQFYLGKRVAYVCKAKTEKKGSKFRVIWGRIRRPHGNGGIVRAKFRKNLPPSAIAGRVRVFLYPSNI